MTNFNYKKKSIVLAKQLKKQVIIIDDKKTIDSFSSTSWQHIYCYLVGFSQRKDK